MSSKAYPHSSVQSLAAPDQLLVPAFAWLEIFVSRQTDGLPFSLQALTSFCTKKRKKKWGYYEAASFFF